MLKGISKLWTGDLLKALCDMGHGDELVIADANFPAYTVGQRVISVPGVSATTLLKEIVKLFPLDHAVEHPAIVLDLIPEDIARGYTKADIWDDFTEILQTEYGADKKLTPILRQDFYERSKKAYLVILTGEERLYGDLLLVKGVVE
jgi:L-fucose mutarotase